MRQVQIGAADPAVDEPSNSTGSRRPTTASTRRTTRAAGIGRRPGEEPTDHFVPPPHVLLTDESLRAKPRVICRQGRPRGQQRRVDQQRQHEQEIDQAPSLSMSGIPDQGAASMAPLFRMYADASLKLANLATTSAAVPPEDEPEVEEEAVEEEEIDPLDEDDRPMQLDRIERSQLVHHYKEWPLYWDQPIDFQEACEVMMNMRRVDEGKICNSVPVKFRGEGTFVVDLRNFDNRHDVALDGLGSWGKPTGRTRFYALTEHGRPVRIDDGKGKIEYGENYEYKCMAKRYEHPATEHTGSRFIKKIFTAIHPPARGTAIALAVVCYEWMGPEVDFEVFSGEPRSRRVPSLQPTDGSRTWEAASFALVGMREDETCDAIFMDWPLYTLGAVDFGTASCIILGGINIDAARICARVPQGYRESGTFVIDIRNFVTDAELRRDANGAWGKPAGHSRYYRLDRETGDAIRVDRGHKLIEGSDYDVQILSKRYEHTAVNGRFVRKIYTGRSRSANARTAVSCSNLAVITYYWKGDPEAFEATPQRKVRIAERAAVAFHESLRIVNDSAQSSDGHPAEGIEEVVYMEDEEDRQETGNNASGTARVRHNGDEKTRTGATTSEQLRGPSISTMPVNRVIRRSPQTAHSHRFNPLTGSPNIEQLKAIVYKKEYGNQMRFSSVLDRAEALLDRFERIGDFLPEQLWLNSHAPDTIVVEQVVEHDGEFVQAEDEDGNTYMI